MNDRDLLYFCKLVELGSFTKTADFFEVTQPTISSAIRRLSEMYDDPLVTQKNRKSRLKLTNAGEILFNKGTKITEEIKSLNYDVTHANDKKIRIAFSGIAGGQYMPDIVYEFFQAGIANMLSPSFVRSSEILHELSNGKIDVAIYSWNVPFNDPNYYLRTLEKTEFVIIVSDKDPLAGLNNIPLTKLRDFHFIARDRGYLTTESLFETCHKADLVPDVIYTANTIDLMIKLVQKGMGAAYIHENMVRDVPGISIIHIEKDEQMFSYSQIAMRRGFMPNDYQHEGVEILRNFKRK